MTLKIKKILVTVCIVMLSFVLGVIATYYVSEYSRDMYYVSGIVEYQPKPDPYVSGAPPEVYYLNSSDFGRYMSNTILFLDV